MASGKRRLLGMITTDDQRLQIDYINWRGERRIRNIIPIDVKLRSTPHHPEKQWILSAFDEDKGDVRDFAMNNIVHINRKVCCQSELGRLPEVPGYLEGLADSPLVSLTIEEAQRLREALRTNAEIIRQTLKRLEQRTCDCDGNCR